MKILAMLGRASETSLRPDLLSIKRTETHAQANMEDFEFARQIKRQIETGKLAKDKDRLLGVIDETLDVEIPQKQQDNIRYAQYQWEIKDPRVQAMIRSENQAARNRNATHRRVPPIR